MTAARPSFWLWIALPALACAVLQVVFAVPLRVLGVQAPEPIFAFAAAFAWAAAGASIAAPFVLVALGAFLDLLLGAPIGLWSVCLVTSYAAAFLGAPLIAGQSAATHLVWYLAVTALAFVLATIMIAAHAHNAPNLMAVGWQYLATAALFPVAWRLALSYQDADVRFR